MAFHHQIEALVLAGYPTIAIDLIPYGQSDKRPGLDYRSEAVASGVLALLDRLGVGRFLLVGHDRGCVIGDYLVAQPGAEGRVPRYVRMQQFANRLRGRRQAPHQLMASAAGTLLYRSRRFPALAYRGRLVRRSIDDAEVRRLDYEFKYRGIAEAAPLAFRDSSVDGELADRLDGLFAKMTMPVLFLQGSLDPDQPPADFFRVETAVPDGTLRFVEAGHFLELEAPDQVDAALLDFLGSERVSAGAEIARSDGGGR